MSVIDRKKKKGKDKNKEDVIVFNLEPGSVFGDYHIYFDIKTNVEYRAASLNDNHVSQFESLRCMGVHEAIFNRLLDLYPKSKD